MAAVLFQGHYTVIYPDHIDVSTGKTLVCVPGQSYTVTVAPGRNAGLPSLPGDGRWGVSGYAVTRPREALLELPPLPEAGANTTTPAASQGESASPESEA